MRQIIVCRQFVYAVHYAKSDTYIVESEIGLWKWKLHRNYTDLEIMLRKPPVRTPKHIYGETSLLRRSKDWRYMLFRDEDKVGLRRDYNNNVVSFAVLEQAIDTATTDLQVAIYLVLPVLYYTEGVGIMCRAARKLGSWHITDAPLRLTTIFGIKGIKV